MIIKQKIILIIRHRLPGRNGNSGVAKTFPNPR